MPQSNSIDVPALNQNQARAPKAFEPLPGMDAMVPSSPSSVVRMIASGYADPVSYIWRGQRITEYLLADDHRRHVWHLCLATNHPVFRVDEDDDLGCARLYRRFTFESSRALLAAALGTYPRGLIGVLGRLLPEAWQPCGYLDLTTILVRGGHCAKHLRHEPYISEEKVSALATIALGPYEQTLVGLFKRGKVAIAEVALLSWMAVRMHDILGAAAVERLINSPSPVAAFRQAWLDLPFPPPPWDGDRCLKPVLSRTQLAEIAAKLQNCLRDERMEADTIRNILNGAECFYHWRGKQEALLRFKRVAGLGWMLQEAKSVLNEEISWTTQREIESALTEAPNLCFSSLNAGFRTWLQVAVGPMFFEG